MLEKGEREVLFTEVQYLSGILGAKQLVVVMTQTTFSGLKSLICFSTAARSVLSSSPSETFSTITGSNPGTGKVRMESAFK